MSAEELLQEAITAIQQGDRRRAVRLLGQILEREPRNAAAWYWLSKTQDDPVRKRECLVRTLRFQPNHAQARTDFEALESHRTPQQTTTQPIRVHSNSIAPAVRSRSAVKQAPQTAPRGNRNYWLWFVLMGFLLVSVLCMGALLLTTSFWQPFWDQWVGNLDLPLLSLGKSERLPAGLSIGYWMLDVQRPLPQGVYIGDLVLLPKDIFWFGYLRGKYRVKDNQTLTLCAESRDGGPSLPCFDVRVTASQNDQVVLDIQMNTSTGEHWVENLLYRKIMDDRRGADLASDLVGRWQSFPLDHHTRVAQGRGSEGSVDEVYLFTASGELWAGGRMISSYRIEEDTLRIPDYFGDFGERFQVDRLGDWMVLVGQINKPEIILSLKRLP